MPLDVPPVDHHVQAATLPLEELWTIIIDLEVMLYNTHPLRIGRRRDLRDLIRIYRKGLPK